MLIVLQSVVYGFGDPISKIAFDRITFRRGEEEELEWTP